MRLSEAIRLGAMLKPQCFGTSFAYDNQHVAIASCAMGAAEDAGYTFGRFTTTQEPCPECGKCFLDIETTAAHLNDDHLLTREQIADWVATVEPADEGSVLPKFADAVARTAETVTG